MFDMMEEKSVVNWVLDGNTYPSQKLVPSSLCKNEAQQRKLGIGNAI
jgi:hypothetical protein